MIELSNEPFAFIDEIHFENNPIIVEGSTLFVRSIKSSFLYVFFASRWPAFHLEFLIQYHRSKPYDAN